MDSDSALNLEKVKFRYTGSDHLALNDVSVEIRKGEFVSVLGANGSGKSTLCLLANGLIPHTVHGEIQGTVRVFGEDAAKKSVAGLSARVGMVFQEPESQLFCMSVEEEVAFGPENLGVPREEIRERVEWALELVDMNGYNERSPFSLSGGQKQRVAIAAALSMRPDMLVLDEPAYALDPVGRIELYKVLRELKERHGMTVLLAERDAEEASLYSDEIVLLESGKVVATGSPRTVLRDPESLASLGIAPPQMSQVSALLRSRLPGSDFSFTTVDEAERAIVNKVLQNRRSGSV
jgi:energy-coupling factor transporter ATP-binding protein EcfA2